MAYRFARASSQYISAASAAASSMPLTLFARVSSQSDPASSNVRVYLAISSQSQTPGANAWLMYEFISSGHAWQSLAGISAQDALSGGMTASVWRTSAAVFSSATSRTYYRDTTAGTGNTTSLAAGSVDRTTIGANFNAAAITNFADHDICDAAIWTAALNTGEIASLARGFKPSRIRPQSLAFYAPLVRNLQDVRGNLSLTNNNGATVANHPRVY